MHMGARLAGLVLQICSLYVPLIGMSRIDEHAIATVVLNAPGWARVGLTAPKAWLRHDAALEVARAIVDELGRDLPEDAEQEQLPL